jgi:hypothetical protein
MKQCIDRATLMRTDRFQVGTRFYAKFTLQLEDEGLNLQVETNDEGQADALLAAFERHGELLVVTAYDDESEIETGNVLVAWAEDAEGLVGQMDATTPDWMCACPENYYA